MALRKKRALILAIALLLTVFVANTALAAVPDYVYGGGAPPPDTTPPTPPPPDQPSYVGQDSPGSQKTPEQVQSDLLKLGVTDVEPSEWYAGPVTILIESGLMSPSPDGKFEPEAELDNFDGITVFARLLGVASKTDPPFMALAKMKSAGLVSNFAVGDVPMTRIEVARLLAKALGLEPKTDIAEGEYPFGDNRSFGNDYDRGVAAALFEAGVFLGFDDGTFRPTATLTKAQIAVLVDRILGSL